MGTAMIDDPYKVLGVSPSASMDEVKKAYRQKAKMYHPDMHPDDPRASEKMNEVNEAYDMITNPDKYRQRREQEQQAQQARQSYGGYGGGYGGTGSQGYGGAGSQGQGDFNGFDFEEIFRQFYGANAGGSIPNPQPRAGDPAAFTQAVNAINAGQYQQAVRILSAVVSTGRNARWYYLYALSNFGAGNRVAAWESIQKAAAMEPINFEYAQLKRTLSRYAQNYESTGRSVHIDPRASGIVSLCASMCLMQLCCRGCYC